MRSLRLILPTLAGIVGALGAGALGAYGRIYPAPGFGRAVAWMIIIGAAGRTLGNAAHDRVQRWIQRDDALNRPNAEEADDAQA